MYRPRGFRNVLRQFCAFHIERQVFAHAQIVGEGDVVRGQKAVVVHSPVQPGELFAPDNFVAAALALAHGFADNELWSFRYRLLHGGDSAGEQKVVRVEEHQPLGYGRHDPEVPRCAGAFVFVAFDAAEPRARVCGGLYDGFQLFVRAVDHDGRLEVFAQLQVKAFDGVADGVGAVVRGDNDVDGLCLHFPPPLRFFNWFLALSV